MAKGYLFEIVGCAIIAGGMPLLLSAVLGPLFSLGAFLLPSKEKSILAAIGINNVQSACWLGALLLLAMALVNVALVMVAISA